MDFLLLLFTSCGSRFSEVCIAFLDAIIKGKITFARNPFDMELLYVWVKEYKNIREQGFNFSPAWRFEYNSQNGFIAINDRREKAIPNFFGVDISNVTAIVGENGCGKSNLMEFLIRLFDRGTGFWNESFIAVFLFEGNIRIWHYQDLPLKTTASLTGLEVQMMPFKMRDTGTGMSGGTRGENEIDQVNSVYYSQYVDGLKKRFGLNRNKNFFDISNFRYMVRKVTGENGEKEEFISPKEYYLKDVRRQAQFFGAGGESLFDFPIPHFLKITVNEEVNPNRLTEVFSNIHNPISSNYGANEIWDFLERPGFIAKAFRSLLFSALIDSSAMTVLGPEYIEGLKRKIKDFPLEKDPLTLLEGWRDGASANFDRIHQMTTWVFKNCVDFIHDQPEGRIFKTDEDALVIPTGSPLIEQFFSWLEDIDIRLSLPFNFSWTFEDDPLWDGALSSGHNQLLNFFARIYSTRIGLMGKTTFFFVDEGEIGLHPQLQKQYINLMVNNIPRLIPRPYGQSLAIQIILTSHSPFILSDLPRENVIFLEKNEDGTCKVANGLQDMSQTFGANIHTLLSDAFFLRRHEGLMGAFSKNQIDKVIRYYQEGILIDGMDMERTEDFAEKIVSWIGEPIIRRYLQHLQHYRIQKRLMKEVEQLRSDVKQIKEGGIK